MIILRQLAMDKPNPFIWFLSVVFSNDIFYSYKAMLFVVIKLLEVTAFVCTIFFITLIKIYVTNSEKQIEIMSKSTIFL